MPEGLECVEDGGDLDGALLGLAGEVGGEGLGGLPDAWQELAEDRHLRREFGRPIENNGCSGVRCAVVVAEADFGLLGGGSTGGLKVRAQPADEAALFFRRPFVVESDEAGENELFEGFGIGAATGEGVGGWGAL